MTDIVENIEEDKDTLTPEELEQQFNKKYTLMTAKAVSLKKTYITNLHGTKSLKLAVSLLDNTIEAYELNNISLSSVCRLSGHKDKISEVVFSPNDDHLVFSAGHDGYIKLWDTRLNGSCVNEYIMIAENRSHQLKPYECLDISGNGRLLCAGTQLVEDDAFLVFWDQRMPKPLGGYWNSHRDDITQVKFHKEKPEVIVTGSMDNLLNIFNLMEQTEDDALMYSMNVDNAVEKLNWLDSKYVSCVTFANDLQVWDAMAGDLVKNFPREKIARSIKRSREDDCYLVDAFTSTDDTHVVLAGSYGGNCQPVLRSVTITEKKLRPTTAFKANKQIVRCSWYDKERDILVTGGESGILDVWGRSDEDAPAPAPAAKLSASLDRLHVNRHKPY